jgi:hypothetical protein
VGRFRGRPFAVGRLPHEPGDRPPKAQPAALPREEYWMAKAEEARLLAIGMRDPISRRRMFELAVTYDARAEQEADRADAD